MEYSGQKRPFDEIGGQDSGDGSNFKRLKESPPSKVLHVRGLPSYATEQELVSICSAFGTVVRTLMLTASQQAFIQMDTVDAATNILNHHQFNPAMVRTKPIYFQYSNRQEIKTSQTNSHQMGMGGGGMGGMGDESKQQANSIILISVLNARVPVTLENIHQICKPYGEVLKIITFLKNNEFKALVQFATVEAALNAKLLLEGKDMFQGCCHLRIGFSTLKALSVKSNGPKSRDFSMPDANNTFQPDLSAGGYGGGGGGGPYSLFSSQASQQPYGGQQAPDMSQWGQQFGQFGMQNNGMGGGGAGGKGCVILVNNLNESKVTLPEHLFTLFGVYGDVMRVKILFQKRSTAMIQFAQPDQAQRAILHLNHLNWHGNELKISASKHPQVSLPRADGTDEDGSGGESAHLTKDFSGSPIHRYKHRGNRSMKNIHAPSQVLHVSNLHEEATEDELRKLFGEESKGEVVVQFFANDRKMAYVRLDSVNDAVCALVRLHNHKLNNKYMRISFSAKDQSEVRNTDQSGGGGGGSAGGAGGAPQSSSTTS